jgi:hypothetical protein
VAVTTALIREHIAELEKSSPLTPEIGALNERSNTHRCHWIQSLLKRGLEPDFCILERLEGEWPWLPSTAYTEPPLSKVKMGKYK